MRRGISVLGSTGSIGTATLDVIGSETDRFRVAALAAGSNLDLLRRQIIDHRPALVSVASPDHARGLRTEFPGLEVEVGPQGLAAAAGHPRADTVVVAVTGAVGLEPTVAAIRAGKDIALANKETLVIAGELVMAEAAAAGVGIQPVDSEHSGLEQILRSSDRLTVDRLILTASGGPFRLWSLDRMATATVADALAHPTWTMGPKISIDSATMVNKGLEIIEAHHLFGLPEDRIDVVIHPQSLVHSMVAHTDGTILAQLSANDMRIAIRAALSWPDRPAPPIASLDLTEVGRLEFSEPDAARFPAMELARSALRAGGEMPAVLNAANEVAVSTFLAGGCSFDRIAATIDAVMNAWNARNRSLTTLDQVMAADEEARRIASDFLGNTSTGSGVPNS
jgi:1-deoxy-D-xylulose-5-phosphate reductoisomerase